MGDNFQVVVDLEATTEEAAILSRKVLSYLWDRKYLLAEQSPCVFDEPGYPPGPAARDAVMNPEAFERGLMTGVEVIVGRQNHGATEEGPVSISCPNCLRCGDCEAWFKAADDWENHNGEALIRCGACSESSPVTQWIHNPPWCFVNLGFRFWNWPSLRQEVISEIAKLLGHRVEIVQGML
jgi:hypothetical protein